MPYVILVFGVFACSTAVSLHQGVPSRKRMQLWLSAYRLLVAALKGGGGLLAPRLHGGLGAPMTAATQPTIFLAE